MLILFIRCKSVVTWLSSVANTEYNTCNASTPTSTPVRMTRVFTATRAFDQLQYLLWHQFYTSSYRCCTEEAASHFFGRSIWSGMGESDSRDFRQIAIWKCNLSLFYLKASVVGGKEQREVAAALLLTSLSPCSSHVSVSVLYFDAIAGKHEFSSLSSTSERDASVNPKNPVDVLRFSVSWALWTFQFRNKKPLRHSLWV